MVRGASIAVNRVDPTYQWAEVTRTALGTGMEAPNSAQARV